MKNNLPLISIIVPVFNAENYLSASLDTLISQTYNNLEIILVDDGSRDRSAEICKTFAAKDNRIKYIRQPNQGPGIARNTGLDNAAGEYITFVDSDDYVDEDMLEGMISVALRDNADIVQCGYEKIETGTGNVVERSIFTEKKVCNNKEILTEYCKKKDLVYYSHTKLIRREIIGSIRFRELTFSEDALFLLECFMHCRVITIINKPWYKYIQTPQSICRSAFSLKNLDTVKAGKLMFEIGTAAYPDLAPYFSRYIVQYAAFCFKGVYNSDLPRKEELLGKLRSDFRQYYRSMKNSGLKLLTLKQAVYYTCFNIAPRLISKLT